MPSENYAHLADSPAAAPLAPAELRRLGGDRTHPLLTQVIGNDTTWWPDDTGDWTELAFSTDQAQSQDDNESEASSRATFKAPTGETIYTIAVNELSTSGNANLMVYRGNTTGTGTTRDNDLQGNPDTTNTNNIAGTIHLKKISAVRIWHGIQVSKSEGHGKTPDLQISAPILGSGNCSLGLPIFGVTKEKLGSETNEIVWRGATVKGAAHHILVDRHGTLICVWQPLGEAAGTGGKSIGARLIFKKRLLEEASGGKEVDLLVMVAVAYWENSGDGRKAKGHASYHVSNALDYVGKALIGNNRMFRGTLPADR